MKKEHVEMLIRIDERQANLTKDFNDFQKELKTTLNKYDTRINILESARQRVIGMKETIIALTSGGAAAGLVKLISYISNKIN